MIPSVVACVRDEGAVVLRAETGAGKTTRVPPALLDAELGPVLVLEPRRVAARAAAQRIALERGQKGAGGEVGWQVRHERRASEATRLLVVTEGILLRLLQGDPLLSAYGCVVFDEFHERSLQSDLALAMVAQVRQARDDLRVVVMSATMDAEPVAGWLGCSVVESRGRSHPIEVELLDRPDDRPVPEQVADGVMRALQRSRGHVLAFLPGLGEIQRTAGLLGTPGAEVTRLYGDLSLHDQDEVLRPSDGRKIILATNVAETSLTVPGVGAVVDSGLARIPRRDRNTGLSRLSLEPISKASADQRAGRAGREGPGLCLRLWTSRQHLARPATTEPAVARADLAEAVLQLLAWGERDPRAFGWFEAPPADGVSEAMGLLEQLSAVDSGGITPRGRAMAELPLHPRLAAMLLAGAELGVRGRAALAAAILGERDVLGRGGELRSTTFSDVLDRVELLEGGRLRLPHIDRAARQLERAVSGGNQAADGDLALCRAVLAGWPDRVALRREPGSPRGRMVGGRGVQLDRSSGVRDARLFVCVDVGDDSEARVWQASGVLAEWLPTQPHVELRFDGERVMALHQERYRDLVLREQPGPVPTDRAAEILADAVRDRLDELVPVDFRALQHRVAFLRRWLPELHLPQVEAAELLDELCSGRRSLEQLREAPWSEALLERLSWPQREALRAEAPERITVPSGSEVRVRYEADGPVLAVKIQELFGWSEAPRLARGRAPICLELLAPNRRPAQVTTDLASFWKNTWPSVRKELRGRYPKHAWPEDPLSASPKRR